MAAMDLLRVLTLNCWNVSPPLEERMTLIRAGIEELQPDVIALQEIIVRPDGFDPTRSCAPNGGNCRVSRAARAVR
jgi:hypothetical protein